MKTSFYSEDELKTLGIQKYGKNFLLSRKASLYSPELFEVGDNVRIDDFCILSGKIKLGSNIHISAYCALYGRFGIVLEDFSGISARTTIYSAIDDFSGEFLIGPMVPAELTNVTGGTVILKKYVQLGANCIVFPNVIIGEGTCVGALSLVNKSLEPWGIYAGIPARRLKDRSKELLKKINLLTK